MGINLSMELYCFKDVLSFILFQSYKREIVHATCAKITLKSSENTTQGISIRMELCKINWLEKCTCFYILSNLVHENFGVLSLISIRSMQIQNFLENALCVHFVVFNKC